MPASRTEDVEEIDENELQGLYSWVDGIPLSRPKRNMSRDFSDGVLTAEVVKHYFPQYIELHNYTPAMSAKQKMENWFLLNRKVFKKLGFELSEDIIRAVTSCRQWTIERVLMELRNRIEDHVVSQSHEKAKINDKPEVDQRTAGVTPRNKKTKGKQAAAPPPPAPKPEAPRVARLTQKSLGAGGQQQHKAKNASQGDFTLMVTRETLEEKEQECLAKEETIQILQAKVRRLEHLLHLKDLRIEDLQSKIETLRPTGIQKR